MWQKLACLAIAGALGTLARYGLTGLAQRITGGGFWGAFGANFPVGTLAVNVLGCFLFGLAWSLLAHGLQDGQVRLVVFVGFLGAFTTFSTYAFEGGQMVRDARWAPLAAHLMLQNGLGLAAVLTGLALGKGG